MSGDGDYQLATCDNPAGLARLVVLSADAGLLAQSQESASAAGSFRRVLLPVFDVLQSAGSHVYMSKNKNHRSTVLMVNVARVLNAADG